MFKLNPTAFFAGIISNAGQAETFASKVTGYVLIAEQMGAALTQGNTKFTGADKLAAVQKMLLADLAQSDPALAAWVQKAWPQVAGAISVLITFLNFIGWAFQTIAPILSVADPGAIPAITAVNAAVTAAQTLEKAVSADPQPAPVSGDPPAGPTGTGA